MRTLPIVALASLASTIAFAGNSVAHADSYIGLGIGSEASIEGDLGEHFGTDTDSATSRLLIGKRMGAISIEGVAFGAKLQGQSSYTGPGEFSTLSLGVAAKYHLGLIGGLEGYGKIGFNRTWLQSSDAREDWSYSGSGGSLGAGLQYRFNLALTEVAVWADYTHQTTELIDGEREVLSGDIGMANLGISIGF